MTVKYNEVQLFMSSAIVYLFICLFIHKFISRQSAEKYQRKETQHKTPHN